MIPQIFFQTSKDPPNPTFVNMIRKQIGDDWSYSHYRDADILRYFQENPEPEFPNIADLFNQLERGEHKADLFRYYHIYTKGGFFIDSDAMIYAPIDDIVRDRDFVCVMSSAVAGSFFQGVIGAAPKNPVIHAALKALYTMNPSELKTDYHRICKDIYRAYTDYEGDKSRYHLLEERNRGRDIVDPASGRIVFRHFWDNKDGIPAKKNLIYMAVFHNKQYLELLQILMVGVKLFTKTDDIDFMVMTTTEFIPDIVRLSTTLGIPIATKIFGFTSMHESSCARLYIYDYEHVAQYDTLMYIDTDIVVQGDLATLFDLDIGDKICALSEGTIEHEYHGGWFFDFTTIDKNTPGMNAGIMLFRNTAAIRAIFAAARNHIETRRACGEYMPACLDQPFMNYHIIRAGKQNTALLKDYAMIYCYDPPPPPSAPTTIALCHFVWPLGNASHKRDRMVKHMDHIFANYRAIYDVSGVNETPLLSRSFGWSGGTVTFEAEGRLRTPWTMGAYKWLDQFTVEASWSIYSHILRFNSTYTSFFAVRKGDFLISVHLRQP